MKLTKSLPYLSSILRTASCVTAAALAILNAHGHPYASQVTNNAGTIQFVLNENADNVGVSFDNGAATNNLGALSKGPQSFALAGHTNFAIYVFKVGAGVPAQISSDTNVLVVFNAPRGVAVNADAKAYRFGRIYVANSTPGGSTNATNMTLKARGLYIYNADLTDALGRGTNASGTVAFVSDALSPNRLTIAPDDTVYASDCSAAAATIISFDPDITVATTNLLPRGDAGVAAGVHGRIASAPSVRGSIATGDLTIWDNDSSLGPNFNEVEKYSIGAGPVPWSNAPTPVVNLGLPTFGVIAPNNLTQPPTDLDVAPDGKLFAAFNRSLGNYAVPGLQVFSPSGTLLFDSITAAGGTINNGPDFVNPTNTGANAGAYGVRVSPDGRYVVVMAIDNHASVFSLTNGVPDANTFFTFTNLPAVGNGRDVAWDAADNIYIASSGQGLLRVFSLGLTTTSVTGNDSTGTNGTFNLVLPSTIASVVATTPNASQSGPTPGVFTITRTNANADFSAPVTINFTLTGTATNGTYTVSPAGATNGTVVIAAGQSSTNITITPVVDGLSRPTITVVLTLRGGATYSVVAPFQDTVFIANAGPQFVFVSGTPAPSMYKGLTNDFASVAVTRWGDLTAASYTVSNFTYAGTAVLNVDYTAATPVTINPGDVNVNSQISPLVATTNYVGNKTVVLSVANGTGYSAGTNKGTLTIIDNATPPATVLYANPLTDPNDAANWHVTAANSNMATNALDSTINFGYDLTTNNPSSMDNGIIPLPPSGATNALRVTVNKSSAQGAGASAGVNLYPNNVSFSGDYAVRFSMNIAEGANDNFTTEGASFGIDHGGTYTNWWSGSSLLTSNNWSSDGVWYWVSADGNATFGDYIGFTGLGGTNGNTGWLNFGMKLRTAFTNVFKSPVPYSTETGGTPVQGLPANSSPANGLVNGYSNSWADVEIKQVKNLVTLSINKTAILGYTNATIWTNGTLMLGYGDPFSSVGAPDAAVYYSNLRVVRIGPPIITQIALSGTNVIMNFTSTDGDDTTASFAVQSTTNLLTTAFADVSPAATFTQLGTGAFQAATSSTTAARFYRIRHK